MQQYDGLSSPQLVLNIFLRYLSLVIFVINLFLSQSEALHAFKFFLGIIKVHMCVHIHRYAYIRMPHKILQCLWIHACLSHHFTLEKIFFNF